MKKLALLSLCVLVASSAALADSITYVGDDANGDLDGMIKKGGDAVLTRTAVGDDGVTVTELDGSTGANSDTDVLLFLDFIGNGANQVAAGKTITSATLKLWYSNDNGNKDIDIYRLTSAFDATTKYSTFGGGTGVASGGTDGYTQKFGSADPVLVTIDVTAEVIKWVEDGEANYGWGFSEETGNGCEWTSVFASGGGTTGNSINPTLEVEYTPEPATMSLLALGGLAVLRRRRK